MKKYHREISGDLTLRRIQNAVNGEEALINSFIGSRLWVNGASKLTNLVEFEELEDTPESQPNLMTLSASEVNGRAPVWVGIMVVEGTAKSIWIYRAA